MGGKGGRGRGGNPGSSLHACMYALVSVFGWLYGHYVAEQPLHDYRGSTRDTLTFLVVSRKWNKSHLYATVGYPQSELCRFKADRLGMHRTA